MKAEMEEKTPATPQKRSRWGAIAVWVALFALLAIVGVGLARSQQGPVTIGKPVPDFTLQTFDGQNIRLADLRGKVVVINFWASWCKPCEQEAADLEAAWRYYQSRGDVVFLGVNWTDTPSGAAEYLSTFEISFINGPDKGTRIADSFRITGVPETYIINQQGNLAYKKFSPFASLAEIQQAIDPLLAP